MFGDPFEANHIDQNEKEQSAEQSDLSSQPLLDGSFERGDDPERLPWEELDTETMDEIEDEVDHRLCDHDDHKEVVPNQEGAGASFAGSGVQATITVNKIVCTKCGQEWNTQNGSQPSRQDPFGF